MPAVYEALECLGGNGYTEDLPLARYFRESPLNAIWEGSGNVMALDAARGWPTSRAAMATVGAHQDGFSRVRRDRSPKCWRACAPGDAERRARFCVKAFVDRGARLAESNSQFATLTATRGGAKFCSSAPPISAARPKRN
jgi:putative acyl-CoA dehydrogenase